MSENKTFINTIVVWGVCVIVLLSGCRVTENQEARMVPHRTNLNDELISPPLRPLSMLVYYDFLQKSSEKELEDEYLRMQSGNLVGLPRQNQLKLALLLSLRDKPIRDDQRARALVDGFLGEQATGDDADKAFALFLRDLLKERERYEQQVNGLQRRMEDYALIKKELEKERELREKLENQLDQLKEFEQNLIEREHSKAPPFTEQDNGNDGKSQGTLGR